MQTQDARECTFDLKPETNTAFERGLAPGLELGLSIEFDLQSEPVFQVARQDIL